MGGAQSHRQVLDYFYSAGTCHSCHAEIKVNGAYVMSKYKGKKVLIVGFGLSGVASAKFFARQGANVVVTDMKQKTELNDSVKECADLKIEYDLGKHTPKYFHEAELIVLSPGVPANIKPLEEAREKQVPV